MAVACRRAVWIHPAILWLEIRMVAPAAIGLAPWSAVALALAPTINSPVAWACALNHTLTQAAFLPAPVLLAPGAACAIVPLAAGLCATYAGILIVLPALAAFNIAPTAPLVCHPFAASVYAGVVAKAGIRAA